jgi:hypothetical protein
VASFLLVRRYAPFATFGGGFEGDTRTEATTSPTATARTIGIVSFEPSGVLGFTSYSSGSTFEGAGPWLAEKIGRHFSKVKAELSNVSVTPGTLSFTVHTAGANPLVPIVAPDIDTYVDFKVTFGDSPRYEGTVRGDTFPNAEVFVVEPNMREVLLFDYRTAGGRNTGPLTRLAGDNSGVVLGHFDVLVVAIGPQVPVKPTPGT